MLDYNLMSEERQDVILNVLDEKGAFTFDFKVDGKLFSSLSSTEKSIVFMQMITGSRNVTTDTHKYDPTLVSLNDDEHIISYTPYGIIGVSNVLDGASND